jgi:aminoglycoside phosphotransferase family enzyme
MSWVFLTRDRAYKLKKPVRLPYLDFSTLSAREAMCRAEARLNRRLASDVYLGVVPLVISQQGLSLVGPGRVVDWLVVMRRLDERFVLERLISERGIRVAHFDAIAHSLSRFFRRARRQLVSPESYLMRWHRDLAINRQVLSDQRFAFSVPMILRIDRAQRLFLLRHASVLAERASKGHLVEGHGDLRPEHISLEDGVTIIDCIEFNTELRRLDPMQELAYLDLECRLLGAEWGGARVRRAVVAVLRDPAPEALYLFYRCYSATLRARLAIAHLLEPYPRLPEKWPGLARKYLRLADEDAARLTRLITAQGGLRGSAPRGPFGLLPRAAVQWAAPLSSGAHAALETARRNPSPRSGR